MTVFQIIAFMISPLEGEDVQSYGLILIRDIFDSLDDINSLIMLANRNKLPDSFPDDFTPMGFIFCLWKQLSLTLKNSD